MKTRKELTDYVEETFGCIVCMVGFHISTDNLSWSYVKIITNHAEILA